MTVEHLRQWKMILESIEDLPDFDEVDRQKTARTFDRNRRRLNSGWPKWVRDAYYLSASATANQCEFYISTRELPALPSPSVTDLYFGIMWQVGQEKFSCETLTLTTSLNPDGNTHSADEITILGQNISQVLIATELAVQPIKNIWRGTGPIEWYGKTWNVNFEHIPIEIESTINTQLLPFKQDLTFLAQSGFEIRT